MENRQVSEYDKDIYLRIRSNVTQFIESQAKEYDAKDINLLDVAPQIHAGAKQFFKKATIFVADIDEQSGADFIIDICNNNKDIIEDSFFDIIVCTEVLEHTLNPFDAVSELFRLLKPSGILLISTPYDFRIHGPLPDCWRFTEHGLRALLKNFSSVNIIPLENENRFLMPYHYTTIAKKG